MKAIPFQYTFCYLSEMRNLVLLFFCLLFCGGAFAQSEALASNYFDQGQYEKSESIYRKLYKREKGNSAFLMGLVSSLQQQEKYKEAGEYLLGVVEKSTMNPAATVELGYNFQLEGDLENAQKYYEQALDLVKQRPNYAYVIGNAFQDHNLLDEAVQTYETALKSRPNTTFTIQVAQIYGEQGKLQKMFESFLDLIKEKPKYFYAVNRNFSTYITDDPENEANQILRKLLLKKSQQNPDAFYNEMLSWLFVQQNQFKKAFIQEKALYTRSPEKNLRKISDLAKIAAEKEETETAKEMLKFVIEKATTPEEELKAYANLMEIKLAAAAPKSYNKIDADFQKIFDEYGRGTQTLALQLQYAKFLAFQQDREDDAISLLNQLLSKKPNRFNEARLKMVLADILVVQEKFNQALIYYSQVQNLVKNTELAQEANFKVAQTSYYKGDFSWAQTQLKVLKSSTTQLIANDAMELSLLIRDNSQEDSTQTALKLFAKADLYIFQQKNEKALQMLDTILVQHKGEKIEDEALFRKAKLEEEAGNFQEAEQGYLKIIQYYGDDILADDAYYFLAELYRTKLNQPEKAKENYEQIIFNFADSIYFVDARKKFRELRGDAIE